MFDLCSDVENNPPPHCHLNLDLVYYIFYLHALFPGNPATIYGFVLCIFKQHLMLNISSLVYSIAQEICTRFLLCRALLWLYIDWFFPYPSGLLHWHCGNLTIAPVPAKQPWWIWINTSCEFNLTIAPVPAKQPWWIWINTSCEFNLTIAPVPAKQPWWIWINTSCEFIMNDCITTAKQSTTKPCAYFLGYTVPPLLETLFHP